MTKKSKSIYDSGTTKGSAPRTSDYKKYSDNYISIVYNKQLINKSDFIGDLLKYILNINSIKQINQLSYLILTTNIPITVNHLEPCLFIN